MAFCCKTKSRAILHDFFKFKVDFLKIICYIVNVEKFNKGEN